MTTFKLCNVRTEDGEDIYFNPNKVQMVKPYRGKKYANTNLVACCLLIEEIEEEIVVEMSSKDLVEDINDALKGYK